MPYMRYQTWDKAVEIVDGRHGYAIEFAPDPDAHRAEYDAEYRRLRREEIADAYNARQA
jgi:hypothetical protein